MRLKFLKVKSWILRPLIINPIRSFFITEKSKTRSLGMTILLWAAINNSNPEVLQVLLNAGADKDATFLQDDEGNGEEFEGWNALHFAASGNSNPEVLQTLLNAGFDKNAKTSTTLTAYDIAIDKNPNPEVANVLK